MFKRFRALPQEALRRDQGGWLLATALVTLAPYAGYYPVWVSVLCAAVLVWRGVLLWYGRRPPHRVIPVLLGVAACIGVRFEFGYFFGKDPGVALLGLLLVLKLLESGSNRDIRAGILLCFFLQLGLFFDNQSLPIAGLTLIGCLLAVISLLALADTHADNAERVRTAGLLMAHGLPFMVLFFVLFPRLDSPLWALPTDGRARTGLSDSMQLGGISQLSLSDEIAFRATFEGNSPEPAIRYWRGPVLTQFDGVTWRPFPVEISRQPFYQPTGRALRYRVTLEPHNQRWLLGLDFPVAGFQDAIYTEDFQVLLRRPLSQRARFDFTAYPETPVGVEGQREQVLAEALRLPTSTNPRTFAFAKTLAENAATPDVIVQRGLDYLRQSGFIYTLEPPPLGANSIDEFLFDTRAGFCEHFSAAFVFMMRAANVPARVVTGYLGGEINPIDGSLVVRQSDAHAWAEVWLEGKGWVRVDPTSQAAPRRVENGMVSALPEGAAVPFMLRQNSAWLRELRFRWEAMSNAWNQWVLGYDFERQRALLERLGLEYTSWSVLIWGIAIGSFGLFGLLLGWSMLQRRKRDPLERIWDDFCARMRRKGYPRQVSEGPVDYGRRLAIAFPAQAESLLRICNEYARLRYRPPAPSEAIKTLMKHVRSLKVK